MERKVIGKNTSHSPLGRIFRILYRSAFIVLLCKDQENISVCKASLQGNWVISVRGGIFHFPTRLWELEEFYWVWLGNRSCFVSCPYSPPFSYKLNFSPKEISHTHKAICASVCPHHLLRRMWFIQRIQIKAKFPTYIIFGKYNYVSEKSFLILLICL